MSIQDDSFQIRWPKTLAECDGPCRDPKQGRKEKPYFQDSMSLDGIKQNAARGCPKCMLIYHCCRGFKPKGGFLQIFRSSDDTGVLSLHAAHQVNLVSHEKEIYVQMYIQDGEPETAWRFIRPGRFPMASRREEYVSRLAHWISECDTSHSDCTMKDNPLPHRVIDIGIQNDSQLLLHVSSGQIGRYMALSHCWGPEHLHPPKTNLSNLKEYQEAGIGVTSLPKTFQDAIAVARNLGIRYLWIDSLCIVQDDTLDWQRESSKMADYYSNAYLVISASQAENSTQGLLDAAQRDLLLDPGSGTEMGQITNADGSITRIHRRVLGRGLWRDRHHELLEKSPLSRRAWCLQEHILAKRIVHFTKSELLWECTQGLKCECLETDHAVTSINRAEGILRKFQFLSLRYATEEPDPDLYRLWLGVLQQYSYMDLSYESDVLPALSGLAKLWISQGAGKYLAGFWEKNILESIFWHVTEWGERHSVGEYRAPSWSPCSLEIKDEKSNRRRHIRYFFVTSTSRLVEKCARVLDAGVILAGADPTGQIRSAFLQLEGRVIRGKVSSYGEIQTPRCTYSTHWDTQVDRYEGLSLLLLLIGFNSLGGAMVLVLKDAEQEGAYERVTFLNQYDRKNSSILMEQFEQGDVEQIKVI